MNRQSDATGSTILADIPPDLPFLLRLNPWRHVWRHVRLPMAVFMPFGLAFLALSAVVFQDEATTYHSEKYGDVPTFWIGVLLVVLGLFMLVGVPLEQAWRASRGPVLGAGREGVYLQPMLMRGRTLYLPWDLIESASVRRWRGPHLCLKPKEAILEEMFSLRNSSPTGGARDRAVKSILQKRMGKALGTNIALPVGGAQQGPQGVLDALRQWSGGRI